MPLANSVNFYSPKYDELLFLNYTLCIHSPLTFPLLSQDGPGLFNTAYHFYQEDSFSRFRGHHTDLHPHTIWMPQPHPIPF